MFFTKSQNVIRRIQYNRCATKQKIISIVVQVYRLLCSNTQADNKSKFFILPSYDGSAQPNALLYLYPYQNVIIGGIG